MGRLEEQVRGEIEVLFCHSEQAIVIRWCFKIYAPLPVKIVISLTWAVTGITANQYENNKPNDRITTPPI